jgi:hypothetical protein
MPRPSKLTVLILWELHNECDVTLTDQFNFQSLLFDTNSITLSDQRKHVQITNKSFYPAISTFAVQICYSNKFLLYSY